LCSCRFRVHIAVHIVIGAQKFMRKSRGYFVLLQSASRRRAGAALWRAAKAEGLAHSKTLRVFQESSCRAQRHGLRRPSAAFPRCISNRANVNWNRHSLLSVIQSCNFAHGRQRFGLRWQSAAATPLFALPPQSKNLWLRRKPRWVHPCASVVTTSLPEL
jgi:hypothetical protein